MYKLLFLLSILGSLVQVNSMYKAFMIPFLLLPGKRAYEIIEENKFKDTPSVEFENFKAETTKQFENDVEEFNKTKAEFLEEFDRASRDQLAWLDEEKSQYEREYEEKIAAVNAEIERLAQSWEEERAELIQQQTEELEALKLSIAHELDVYQAEIRALKSQVHFYEMQPVKCPLVFGQIADEINSLIDELERITLTDRANFKPLTENYICDYASHQLLNESKTLKVWLKPKSVDATDKILRLANQLTVFNYAHVDIKPARGAILFSLSNEIYEEALTEDLAILTEGIIEPDPKLVKVVFSKFVHAFIWGNTGTGKSTLITNLVDLIDYLNIQDGLTTRDDSVTLFDPKFPHSQLDSENFLNLDGIPVTWSGWSSLYNVCIDLMYTIDQRLQTHFDEAIEQMESGDRAALSILPVQTFVLDELELAIKDAPLTLSEAYDEGLLGVEQVTKFNMLLNRPGSNYGEFTASKVLARVLKIARSSKVRLIGVGQSPMPSHYELLKIDFLNCTRIWLGDVAETIMLGRGAEFVQMPAADKTKIRKQVELRKQINALRFRQGLEPLRYMVVHSPGLPVFIMDCPGIHSFVSDLFGVEHRYSAAARLPKDAYGSASASQLAVKTESVQIPPHSDRDVLNQQLNSMLQNSLTENQQKMHDYLQKHKDEAFSVKRLRDRLSWLSTIDDQVLRVDLERLLKLGSIKLVKGKTAKIQFRSGSDEKA